MTTDAQYAGLFTAIDEQRTRIATFEPVIFHAHSIDSHDWAKAPGADATRNDPQRLATPEGVQEFLDELAARYRVVCITDHMRSGYAAGLAKAALVREDITVLPGMEINCLVPPAYNDAIHLLAIFPPETTEITIERMFQGKEIADPAQRTGKEDVRFEDLRDLRARIKDIGGLFVLAHVENPRRGHRARFRTDRAKTLKVYGDDPQLTFDLPDEYGVYLAKLEPDAIEIKRAADQHHYARFHADGKEHQVACVGPADHHCFEDYDDAGSATLLKIPTADFHSVAEALRFHETRLRLPGQTVGHQAPRLVGLRLASASGKGLFDDTTIAFSENLNCLIGPRGSGKSTVIEALRYVLGRNSQLAERLGAGARNFANLAQSTQSANLRDTRIELVYDAGDGTQTVLSATFDPAEPVLTRAFTPEGEDLHVAAAALVQDFPVAIFSWSEMEVLGRDPGPQRELVDRLLGEVRPSIAARDAIYEQLVENRQQIVRLARQLAQAREADKGALGRYRQYRDAYEAVNTDEAAALFAGLDAARRRRELIDAVAADVEALDEIVAALGEAVVAANVEARVVETPEATRDWWAAGPADAVDLAGLDQRIGELAAELDAAVAQRKGVLGVLRETAVAELQAVEQELRTQTRLDAGQDLMRDQREIARTRFEQVDADRESYLEGITRLDEALEARRGLLSDLAVAQDEISAIREANLAPLNEQLAEVGGDRLGITVAREHLADRAEVERYLEDGPVLTQERAGRYKHRRIAPRLTVMARPADLSSALVDGDPAKLGAEIAIGTADALANDEATKLIENCVWRKPDEDAEVSVVDADTVGPLLELAERRIDDRVRIMLNGKPVDELSPGQRSSAMLPLIALAETDPLIIDQPEDNLDNAMVGDTLTRILADLKERRQIIVSTHNPNIVVGGDAEQVVVLDAPGVHTAQVEHTGSIDDAGVIDAVLTIMEGGREAFDARRKRYRMA
jgi:ABC-type Mn2+/Zn2+ transport system ATPase subunit